MSDGELGRNIVDLIGRALDEDLGPGDCTSNAIFAASDCAQAIIRSKEHGVLSGSYFLRPIFSRIDPSITIDLQLDDGAPLAPGSEICRLQGPVRGILAGERLALNLLQRLSGIATLANRYTAAIAHTRARLLDTRKTTPGLRFFEKRAVLDGGGLNHRFGLYDMMLIKDTHVKRCGGVRQALEKALRSRGAASQPKIEIEVQNADEFDEVLDLCPDRIMLDNMSLHEMRRCVDAMRTKGLSIEIEASGNVTLDTIGRVAETGVDFISCGAITHSVKALDIHLVIV